MQMHAHRFDAWQIPVHVQVCPTSPSLASRLPDPTDGLTRLSPCKTFTTAQALVASPSSSIKIRPAMYCTGGGHYASPAATPGGTSSGTASFASAGSASPPFSSLRPSFPSPALSTTTVYPTLLLGSYRISPGAARTPLKAVVEDIPLERRVQHFISTNRVLARDNGIKELGGASYRIHNREVVLEWRASDSHLIVIDGPLRQPLLDYVTGTDNNAEYEAIITDACSRSVHEIPKEKRLSFGDDNTEYSRIDAMKVAKEQAMFREKAAGFMQAGKALPTNMFDNYSKTLKNKLAPVHVDRLRQRHDRRLT